ncbi:hypothetical protein ACX80J_08665 [Arthrobacter sp. MDB2-24]
MKGTSAMSGTPLFPATVPTADPTAGPARAADFDLLTGWAASDPLIPGDLSVVSMRKLRVLCNQLYSALEGDFPPYGAPGAYAAVAKELERRATRPRQ